MYKRKGIIKAIREPEEVVELYRESFREEFRKNQNASQ